MLAGRPYSFVPHSCRPHLTKSSSAFTRPGYNLRGSRVRPGSRYFFRALWSPSLPRTPTRSGSRAEGAVLDVQAPARQLSTRYTLPARPCPSLSACRGQARAVIATLVRLESLPLTKNMRQSFQRLTENLLDRLLDTKTRKVRSKSATTPPAQSETLLQIREPHTKYKSIPSGTMETIRKEQPQLYYLIQFMIASACRVSEALAITPQMITSTGHVKIKAAKGSQDRIVHAGMSMEYFIKCRTSAKSPFENWSRWFVYRQFKKYGIGIQLRGRKNKSITHALRHEVAKANQSQQFTIKDTKKQLGHKSPRSTKYYHESE